MTEVILSTKYQIVIPKEIREKMALEPGQKMLVIHYMGRITLIPKEDIKQARGFLKGIDTIIEREDDRI